MPKVNVQDYGATPGQDCTAAFVAAGQAAGFGGSVYVPGVVVSGAPVPYYLRATAPLRLAWSIPDGVRVFGDGGASTLIADLPGGPPCRLLGQIVGAGAAPGTRGGVSIERLAVRNLSVLNDQAHAIFFYSEKADAEVADLTVSDVVVERCAGGDGIYFGNFTRDVLVEWVRVTRTERKGISIAGYGTNRRNYTVRGCTVDLCEPSSTAIGFETQSPVNEDPALDGRVESVLVERCYFDGPASFGLVRDAVVRQLAVRSFVLFGSPKNVVAEDISTHWRTGAAGGFGRGLKVYGTGSGVQIHRCDVRVYGPYSGIVVSKVTNVAPLSGCRVEVDQGQTAIVGVAAGDTQVVYHPAGS